MSWLASLAGVSRRNTVVPRHADRYQTHGLTCDIGEIVDLSSTGMRVSCPRRPAVSRGDVVNFSIRAATQKLSVMGRVAWTRRNGIRSHSLGVQFFNLKSGVGDALVELALHGFVAPRHSAGRFAAGSSPLRAAVEVEDLYRVLGVKRDAADAAIHVAYRKAARAYHPDVNKAPDAAEKFATISKAYSVLRDADKRRKYDEMVSRSVAA